MEHDGDSLPLLRRQLVNCRLLLLLDFFLEAHDRTLDDALVNLLSRHGGGRDGGGAHPLR